MGSAENERQKLYPMLELTDEKLLDEIFSALETSLGSDPDPYGEDGSYAAVISGLPVGLRAMAATHHLDVSLTMDDIGWHFLNFGEPGLVRETETGLRELGLEEMANCFVEAHAIVSPLKPEINDADGFYESLETRGLMDRINELTNKASGMLPTLGGSPIYAAWVKYARAHPEKVFRGGCS